MTSQDEPKWLSKELVFALHNESLALFGGSPGIRDVTLLESALAKPRNRFVYEEETSLFDLAAAYCSGIIKNHPFIDGNKRAGLLAARAFLFLNGYAFAPDEVETVRMIEGLAAGIQDERSIMTWLHDNSKPR